MPQFERAERLPPELRSTRYYLFDRRLRDLPLRLRARKPPPALMFDADQALGFQPREELVDEVDDAWGLRLCGLGAPCQDDDLATTAPS